MRSSATDIVVRYSETDMMGIVYHANYLPWLEIGRTSLLKELGFPYKELEAQGLLLPVVEVSVSFRKPAKYDDTVTVITALKERPLVRIVLDYEIRRGEERLATATTTHAFVNRQGAPVKAPRDLMEALRAF